jgi:hypothetical protein
VACEGCAKQLVHGLQSVLAHAFIVLDDANHFCFVGALVHQEHRLSLQARDTVLLSTTARPVNNFGDALRISRSRGQALYIDGLCRAGRSKKPHDALACTALITEPANKTNSCLLPKDLNTTPTGGRGRIPAGGGHYPILPPRLDVGKHIAWSATLNSPTLQKKKRATPAIGRLPTADRRTAEPHSV